MPRWQESLSAKPGDFRAHCVKRVAEWNAEYGAVRIVSRGAEFNGETATLLIQNEYQAFNEAAAYAAAFVLVMIAQWVGSKFGIKEH